jgi:NAD(P) transhydrogenase
MYDFDLVAIGSGPAGQRAAVQAAKLGRRAALIERQAVVGGVCLGTGTVPSKTFREAVLACLAARPPAGRTGDGPGSRRPTVGELLGRVTEVVRREVEVVESQLGRNDVAVIRGEAAFRDPHTLAVTGPAGLRTVTARTVVVAVGTRPAVLAQAPLDGVHVITSDDIVRLARLPRTLAVVGGGVIGIEYASMFAALGVTVTLVEQRARPLDFLDLEIVDELVHQMRKRGVVFRFGEIVESVEVTDGPPRRAVLRLASGKQVTADLVLLSAGRVGATDRLRLGAAGLEADGRGRIQVDSQFRTRVPHIFAAGDVIGYPSLASTSSEQGRLAACYALDAPAHPMPAHFPVGIYAIPEISMVGAPEQELTARRIPYETGLARYREIARGQILGDDSGLFKMVFHREDRRLLGAHAIGSGATELIHIGQAVLGLGGGLDYFLTTVFNYPTLAECYKVAALNAANKLGA